tara:strand:- start:1706 stop:2800 length:1095 start_codon:yes stop_codon:yes gene_type:complete
MKIREITNYLEQIAPLHYQENYDNSGLITGNKEYEVKQALITLDCTEKIVEEAIAKKCELIIAHHPIVFKGLKQLNGKNYVERTIIKAIQNNIAIYAIHTNLDNVHNGVNKKICDKLGISNCQVLAPKSDLLRKLIVFCPNTHADKVRSVICNAGAGQIGNYDHCTFNSTGEGTFRGNENTNPFIGKQGEMYKETEIKIEAVFPYHKQEKILAAMYQEHPYEEVAYDIVSLHNTHQNIGSGMIGNLKNSIEIDDFLKFIKKQMKTDCIRYTKTVKKEVQKIAVCGGSGSFLLANAKQMQADVFITADFKYHDFFDAENDLVIADIGHYESEQFTKELIQDILKENFPKFATHLSKLNTNPINYL